MPRPTPLPMSPSVLVALALTLPLMLPTTPARAGTQAIDGVWSRLDTTLTAPVARREFAAIYDAQRDRYLIFGGSGDPYPYKLFDEVWVLSLGVTPAWTQLVPVDPGPGERSSAQWGYDAARQRLLVFGGYGSHHPGDPWSYLDDVWQLSLDGSPTWTELLPAGTAPQGRLAGSAVYDPLRQRFVGFGGTRGLPVDTWELDLSGDPAWVTVPTDSSSPPGSYGMTTVYDAVRDRMLIFGGSTSDAYFGVHNDTWALDLTTDPPTWHKLAPTGTLPGARRSGTAIYDPLRDRMVVFGGWDSRSDDVTSFLGDAWALDLTTDPPGWGPLAPGGDTPIGRDAMQAVYDPLADRLVVYGGWSGLAFLSDTWMLGWSVPSVAPSMTASMHVQPGVAHVQWKVLGATGSHAAVYRRTLAGPWSSLTTVNGDATGTFAVDDRTVSPGGVYRYQLVVSSQRGSVFGGEVQISVPAGATAVVDGTPRFALEPLWPDPLVGRMEVTFALPSDAPARLEVLDVTGRLLRRREVGGFGVGRHQLELGTAGEFRPGLYFVRLTQAGAVRTQRVVIGG